MRLEQAGPGVSRDGNMPVACCQGRVRVGGGSRRAICSRCASRAAVLRPAARGAAFFSPRCFRHRRRFGEKLGGPLYGGALDMRLLVAAGHIFPVGALHEAPAKALKVSAYRPLIRHGLWPCHLLPKEKAGRWFAAG